MKISVVVNTFNEAKNLERCLASIRDFADEIIVVDMHSTDETVEVAKKFKAKVFLHERLDYVEPARNYGLNLSKADWILLLDPDEELPSSLALELKKIAEDDTADFVEIPRKNIIFGKWITHSHWWPDFLIRFFKKGSVSFSEKIHVPPVAKGKGLRLEVRESGALLHHHYETVSQYLQRLDRYTTVQAEESAGKGELFHWQNLVTRPAEEFFSRFFAGEGYRDGAHGLALALLQAFSELMVNLKLWEKEKFAEHNLTGWDKVADKIVSDFYYWQQKTATNPFRRIFLKIKSKI